MSDLNKVKNQLNNHQRVSGLGILKSFNTNDIKKAESDDNGEGRWVTIHGKHVLIKDGQIVQGNIGQGSGSKKGEEGKKYAKTSVGKRVEVIKSEGGTHTIKFEDGHTEARHTEQLEFEDDKKLTADQHKARVEHHKKEKRKNHDHSGMNDYIKDQKNEETADEEEKQERKAEKYLKVGGKTINASSKNRMPSLLADKLETSKKENKNFSFSTREEASKMYDKQFISDEHKEAALDELEKRGHFGSKNEKY